MEREHYWTDSGTSRESIDIYLTGRPHAPRRFITQVQGKEAVMRRHRWIRVLGLSACVLLAILPPPAVAQVWPDGQVVLVERDLSGPRLGITYIGLKDELRPYVDLREFPRVVSQFGWHSEWQIVPATGGPQFVVGVGGLVGGELGGLGAGVEHGWFRPSMTLAMGVRFPSGVEGGLGPSVQFANEQLTSGLVLAFGKSFQYGGVSLPVNLVYMVHSQGNRISLILGYAIQR